MSSVALQATQLNMGYLTRQGPRSLVSDIDLSLLPGQFVCLIGPNGGGKSTLLKTLGGLLPTLGGSVRLGEEDVAGLLPRTRAQKMALVLTDAIDAMGLRASDVVSLGRTPYLDWKGSLSGEDHRVVEESMHQVGVADLAERPFVDLSDGEKQRVLIARALAQQPHIMILDEPTAHLDLTWRADVMSLLRDLCRQKNMGIVMSSHDFDMSLKLADTLWVIDQHRRWHAGVPEDLALRHCFDQLFASASMSFDVHHGVWTLPRGERGEVCVEGKEPALFWTRHLLKRLGFDVVESPVECRVTATEGKWQLTRSGKTVEVESLKELSDIL